MMPWPGILSPLSCGKGVGDSAREGVYFGQRGPWPATAVSSANFVGKCIHRHGPCHPAPALPSQGFWNGIGNVHAWCLPGKSTETCKPRAGRSESGRPCLDSRQPCSACKEGPSRPLALFVRCGQNEVAVGTPAPTYMASSPHRAGHRLLPLSFLHYEWEEENMEMRVSPHISLVSDGSEASVEVGGGCQGEALGQQGKVNSAIR